MDPLFLSRFFIMILTLSIIGIMGISLYGIFHRPSLIKKIIALTIFSDAANTFAIIIGYRLTKGYETPIPPVVTKIPPSTGYIELFKETSVDPLPQALVLTAIVINLAIIAFLVALTLQVYRVSRTVDVRTLAVMRAREEEIA